MASEAVQRVIEQAVQHATSVSDLSEGIHEVAAILRPIVPNEMFTISLIHSGDEYLDIRLTTGRVKAVSRPYMRQHLKTPSVSLVHRTGKPHIDHDLSEGREGSVERHLVEEYGMRCRVRVPLKGQRGVFGTVSSCSGRPREYTTEHVEALVAFAVAIAPHLEQRLMIEEAWEAGALEERLRTARDVHRSTHAILAEVASQVRNLDTPSADELDGLRRLVNRGLAQTTSLIAGLRSDSGRTDLEGVLTAAAEDESSPNFAVVRDTVALPRSIPRHLVWNVGLIVREALNNARRHSGASSATLTATYDHSSVSITVRDEGSGFPTSRRGNGILGMHEQAEVIGGELIVTSQEGVGTVVRLTLPPLTLLTPLTAGRPPVANLSEGAEPARVLVADPLEVGRQGLWHMLEFGVGCEVVGLVGNVEDLLLRVPGAGADVLVVDFALATEALQQLAARAERLPTRTLVVGHDLRPEQVVQALRLGAAGYVDKGARPGELARAISGIREGRTVVPDDVTLSLLNSIPQPPDPLTPREREVLLALAEGLRNKEIARRLHLQEPTVKFHVANIFRKLDSQTRTEAVRVASERGWIGSVPSRS